MLIKQVKVKLIKRQQQNKQTKKTNKQTKMKITNAQPMITSSLLQKSGTRRQYPERKLYVVYMYTILDTFSI